MSSVPGALGDKWTFVQQLEEHGNLCPGRHALRLETASCAVWSLGLGCAVQGTTLDSDGHHFKMSWV